MALIILGLRIFATSGLTFSVGYMVQWFVGKRTHPGVVSSNPIKALATMIGAIAFYGVSWGLTTENLGDRILLCLLVMFVAITVITVGYFAQLFKKLEAIEKIYLAFACLARNLAAISALIIAAGVNKL